MKTAATPTPPHPVLQFYGHMQTWTLEPCDPRRCKACKRDRLWDRAKAVTAA